MGLQWAEHTIEIAATPEEVFEAITDYESFPAWQSAVIGSEVLEFDAQSQLGELVSFDVDGKVRTIHYTLRYHYEPPGKISWDFIKGQGINKLEGGYEIEPSAAGTRAAYRVGIDVSGVPGPLLKRVHKGTVKKANEDLKAEAERRAAAGAAGLGHPADDDHESAGVTAAAAASPSTSEPSEPEEAGEHPFDMLPGPLPEIARLPGRIMVRVGKRLGG